MGHKAMAGRGVEGTNGAGKRDEEKGRGGTKAQRIDKTERRGRDDQAEINRKRTRRKSPERKGGSATHRGRAKRQRKGREATQEQNEAIRRWREEELKERMEL